MKRCIFYYKAELLQLHGKKVQWIVCQDCQKKISQAKIHVGLISKIVHVCERTAR